MESLPSALSAASVFADAHLSRPTDKVICLWLSCQSLSQNGGAAINKKKKRKNRSGSRNSGSCAQADKNHLCKPLLETFRCGQSPIFFHFTCNLKQMARPHRSPLSKINKKHIYTVGTHTQAHMHPRSPCTAAQLLVGVICFISSSISQIPAPAARGACNYGHTLRVTQKI